MVSGTAEVPERTPLTAAGRLRILRTSLSAVACHMLLPVGRAAARGMLRIEPENDAQATVMFGALDAVVVAGPASGVVPDVSKHAKCEPLTPSGTTA